MLYEGDQSQTYSLLSLYHPSSNGLAERFVQTFKRAMRAGEKDGLSLSQRLAEFLFSYRSTAHATTNASPSELFLQRKLHTWFDLLKPNLKGIVEARQAAQKKHHDHHSKLRTLSVGSPVMVRDFRHSNKWIPDTVARKLGPVTFQINIGDGKILKRHIDHLTRRLEPQLTAPDADIDPAIIQDNFQYPDLPEEPPAPVINQRDGLRYAQRARRAPDRLMFVNEP